MASSSTSSQATTPTPQFAIGAEVFLLDSPTHRNASAGMPTFTVTNNSSAPTSAPAPTLPASLNASSPPAAGSQRIYTLAPTSTTFQVPEARLLSAEGAFKVGDVVRQKTAMLNAVVEKRYVVDGKVRYDIRDELQTVVERVGRDGEAGMNGLVKAEKGGYWPVVAERRE